MRWRTAARLRSSFDAVVELLDPKLRPLLSATEIEVRDCCNRSGFDKSGFALYRWRYEFIRKAPFGSYTAQCMVSASYAEELDSESTSVLELAWTAEVYALGSLSFFCREGRETVHQADLPALDLGHRVRQLLARSARELPLDCQQSFAPLP